MGAASGAFSKGAQTGEIGSSGDKIYKYTLNMNATNSSNIYGASSTVQPASLKVTYCIKY